MNETNQKQSMILLAGESDSGKSFIGLELAKRLGCLYIDIDKLKKVDYETMFGICRENMNLGSSVIMTIPYAEHKSDYKKWIDMANNNRIDTSCVDIKFIWLEHSQNGCYEMQSDNIISSLDDISLDDKYSAYVFGVDGKTDVTYLDDLIRYARL